MAGLWNGKTLRLEEVHRFPNGPVYLGDSLRWDVVRLWAEIQNGLSLAARKYGKAIVSVGADTWGVDYVLLNRHDEMLGQPYAYRDARTNGMMEKAFREGASHEDLRPDGLAVHAVQHAVPVAGGQSRHTPELLEATDCLLFMPDFLHWALVRLAGGRVHHRLHLAVPASAHAQLGDRPAEEVRPARAHLPEGRSARHQARRAAPRRRGADRPAQGQRGCAAHARHRLRGRRRAHRQHRQGQLGLHQFRHLVADGRRGQDGVAVRPHPGAEPDQRGRPGRHVSPAQEHHGPVARAAVQARLRRARPQIRIRAARADGRQGPGAALHRQSRRLALPQPARHAQGHPGFLPRNPAARAEDRRRAGPLRLRKPRAQVPRGAAAGWRNSPATASRSSTSSAAAPRAAS